MSDACARSGLRRPDGSEPGARLRDPWQWPFAADSIWNTPVGSDAVYGAIELRESSRIGVDYQHIVRVGPNDPVVDVYQSFSFGGERCSSDQLHDFTFQIPHDYVIPDNGPDNPYGRTPNSNFAFLQADGEMVWEGGVIARCEPGGPVYLRDFYRWPANRSMASIRGDGVTGDGQQASGMSGLGGTIRLQEFANRSIPHAIKINPWGARDLYFAAEEDGGPAGYKWPAERADNYASSAERGYQGDDPRLVMGSLLAIAPDVTADSLQLSEAGAVMFDTMQNYGVYFTEDAAWDTWDLIAQVGVPEEFEAQFGFSMHSDQWRDEVNRLMGALSVIENNSPSSIGGGGQPRVPIAPPMCDID